MILTFALFSHLLFIFFFCTSLSLFTLEEVIHINKTNGYQTFGHNPDAGDISDAIQKILALKRSNIKIIHNQIKQDIVEEADFEKRCSA